MQDKNERLNPADYLQDYYGRFDADDGYEKLLFRAGKGLQSAELNDMQAQVFSHVQGVADAILKDGDVVSGGEIIVGEDGKVTLGAAKIYLRGQVRTLQPATLTIPVDQILDIGARFTETVVTELEAPALRDPAQGTHNYGEAGSARLKVTCTWGLAADSNEGNFYPVYKVDNGALVVNTTPPQLDSVNVALARYDRESNGGNYVVDGMYASYRTEEDLGDAGKKQVFSIAEGKAHILGYEIEYPTAIRKTFPVDPDLQTIESEPHIFSPDPEGKMRINTALSPIYSIDKVYGTVEISETVKHGTTVGVRDALGNTSVLKVISVKQGDTVYTQGKPTDTSGDFALLGNQIDWSRPGSEPATGSTYTVVYQYEKSIPVTADDTGFTVSGLVSDSLVRVNYQWKMPRIDALTLDRSGTILRVKGIPNAYTPSAPAIPDNQLLLAHVTQNWTTATDTNTDVSVTDQAVRSVSMAKLGDMQSQIDDLYQLLALERLRNNATAEESASKYGVFVDPFLDDDLRDQGESQTAAIIDGELILPVDNVNVFDFVLPESQSALTLDYELEPVIEQIIQTGQMKVNPYQAFEPIPAKAKLTPSVDYWVEKKYIWKSSVSRWVYLSRFWRNGWGWRWYRGRWFGGWRNGWTSSYTQVLSDEKVSSQYLRQRYVRFELSGFGPGEELEHVYFDGAAIGVLK
ncbi:hypothetical protein VA7868_03740 [Vibrio aerogenes CECT 7868]|uniref:DUF4815 domain-containing protein n=1 Tax=Vibrio aerogenes CECT 7868 TaxID=1216006 RepID=A0A1M6B8L0_9VIBR|nr:DUF4815 domain-containing protein [Vibrio aerogenes]SHI45084.1 hypothetical protein VA7868_03740 [Vibrio aerogenes CECT 7868]